MAKTHPSSRLKSGRSYPDEALRAATHPTRQTILQVLQESDRSTTDLERITGENRYNLYHHLAILEQAGLVGHRLRDSRSKEFFLKKPGRRQAAVFQVSREQVAERERWVGLLEALEGVTGQDIPHPGRLQSITVVLNYPSED